MVEGSPLLSRWLACADDWRVAFYDGGARPRATSWAEACAAADRVARALLGGRASLEGERVALLVSPGADFASCLFGVLRAGGCVVVLSPVHPPPETAYFCSDADVRTVIASPELAARVAFLAADRRVLTTEALLHPGRGPVADPILARPTADAAALQLYTSGTTGRPKGAILTHGNLAMQQSLLAEAWAWSETDTLLHVLPLHHLHGLGIAMLSAIGARAATHFLPFDARAVWEVLATAGRANAPSPVRSPTVFMGVPTIHAKLMAALDDADDDARARWTAGARALRLVTSGSAALPVTLGERWRAITGAYPLERFGMTEIGVGASNPLDADRRRPGTVGLPLPTVETRIVGDDGRESASGELWISGPSVFREYHRRPEATDSAFVDDRGRRWFKTGDTVVREDDGYIRILGRTSVDILKSGGYKLSALEIEEALREHGAVAEVAVIGLPDPVWGDRVVACVVARPGRADECSAEELRRFARQRLAPYKVPKEVILMTDLPRNAIGKVIKPDLIQKLSSSRA